MIKGPFDVLQIPKNIRMVKFDVINYQDIRSIVDKLAEYRDDPEKIKEACEVYQQTYPGQTAQFVRMEFDVLSASSISQLMMKLRYDNGFIAYLNGIEVARDNAPNAVVWSSTADTTSPRDSTARDFVEFDLSEHAAARTPMTHPKQ